MCPSELESLPGKVGWSLRPALRPRLHRGVQGDEGLSSDGERGGDEYCEEYSWGIGAEAAMGGEFGGGPWSGEDPGAYGGAD